MTASNALTNPIYFTGVFAVSGANPCGDPLNGNRPRQHADGTGFISSVCFRRKSRNRLQDIGRKILEQQNDRADDGFNNISDRLNTIEGMADARKNNDVRFIREKVLENYEDARAYGATIALKGGTSVSIKGAVTTQMIDSISPVDIESYQITKSFNSEPGDKKGSDTMGMVHVVKYGVYVIRGYINPRVAALNGLTESDVEDIKKSVATLFENDESDARPAGSMVMKKLYWWTPDKNDETYSYTPDEVFDSVQIVSTSEDGLTNSWDDVKISKKDLPGLVCETVVDK